MEPLRFKSLNLVRTKGSALLSDQLDGLSANQAMQKLNTSSAGLSSEEAGSRLLEYGENAIRRKKQSRAIVFLSKFWAPVPWMLEITAILTFIIGKTLDTYIIISLLVFNSLVSFFQESKASDAVELLSSKISVASRVIRDGVWTQLPAAKLVPGDIIHLRMGDVVPADVVIISGYVEVDQSALTGESNPVTRGTDCRLYSGSVVRRGESTCLVVATGEHTYYGKTAELVSRAKSESHLQQLILGIVRYLAVIDVILVSALLAFSFIYKVPIVDTVPFSLVVLIASIPVALPATFTIATAYGALDLAEKGALVTRLSAVEDAASMDTICFDKTGTLTQNLLTARDPVTFGCDLHDLMTYAMLASDESSLDSIDLAVIRYGRSKGIDVAPYKIVDFRPFSPETKRTESDCIINGAKITVAKGATQVISAMCGEQVKDAVMPNIVDLAKRGYRTIGVAVRENGNWKFCGIIPLNDPPRPDSRELIEKLSGLGVRAKMITGDSTPIATEIAREVGLGSSICNVGEIEAGTKPVEECAAFAEVFPEDKFRIVKSLQARGHVTGMTGDGVNDAPALKQAEVGIAVASATDVAKASASIVLTHEGLRDIVSAVEDGRKIYQRMLTYTLNKIIKTVQVSVFLTTAFFIFRFFVTTPFDVILLLFANDFVTMSIATDTVNFSKKPERWRVGSIIGTSVGLAIPVVLESFIILLAGMRLGLNQSQIHTYIFDMLVFSGQFTVYMVRERTRFWKSKPGKWLMAASIGDILFVILISWRGILVTPIPIQDVLFVLILTFLSMFIIDAFKNSVFRHYEL